MGQPALNGTMSYAFGDGEVVAMDKYIQRRYPPRFDRPMFVSTCINNRYTMPQGDVVF